MLIEIDRRIVNTDAIRSIELLDDKTVPDTLRITYLNGDTVSARHSYASLTTMCGAIIPAPSGYQVMTHFEDDDQSFTFDAFPVIAFIRHDETDGQGYPMIPITVMGTASGSRAIVYPSGQCVDEGGDTYTSIDDYQRSVRERFGK